MRTEFPPRAEHISEIERLVGVFACVVENRSAIYVSSPLTTGLLAFEWHARSGSSHPLNSAGQTQFTRDVVIPNRKQAAHYVRNLRNSENLVVIDPSALDDQPGWTQSDYRVFWGRIIEEYCETIVFRDGWQHSDGCAYEFHAAVFSGARLLREDLAPLSINLGRSLLVAAIEELRLRTGSSEFLEGVLSALDETLRGGGE